MADYTPFGPSRITFHRGQQSFELNLPISDDGITEGSEFFLVELLNPDGGGLDPEYTEARVIILDDDFDGGNISFILLGERVGGWVLIRSLLYRIHLTLCSGVGT